MFYRPGFYTDFTYFIKLDDSRQIEIYGSILSGLFLEFGLALLRET